MSYLETTKEVYREAALTPQAGLCCTASKPYQLPGLSIPEAMLEMNYGCGTTLHLQDLRPDMTILYVGVGGGMEALQFAYFTRREGSVIAVDSVPEMLEKARSNLEIASKENPWFDPSFVTLTEGDALELPLPDDTVDLAAQNCLFNIFEEEDLTVALKEIRRVLRPRGALTISDPVTKEDPIPPHLRADERLRALCLSGALPLDRYLLKITQAGFGTLEIRGRRPYRLLDRGRYDVEGDILLETVELAAFNDPVPFDGPCIFTGRTVIYTGEGAFDDGKGHVLASDVPLPVCDKTARWFGAMERDDIHVTPSTYHYTGGGCC